MKAMYDISPVATSARQPSTPSIYANSGVKVRMDPLIVISFAIAWTPITQQGRQKELHQKEVAVQKLNRTFRPL